MKILHVSTMMNWGGGEKQVAYLAEQLRGFDDVEQLMLCPKKSILSNVLEMHDEKPITLAKSKLFNFRWAQKIAQLCEDQKVDLVHVHDSRAHTYALLANLLKKRGNPPTGIIVHRRVSVPLKNNAITKFKYNHPSIFKMICVSRHVRSVLEPAIAKRDKISVVPSGIDLRPFDEATLDPALVRANLGLSPSAQIVVNIGSLTVQKHQDIFIKSAKLLLADPRLHSFDLHFFILGEGKAFGELSTLIARLGLQDRVKLLGFRRDTLSILKAASLLMMTSTNEGLGNVVMEAFASKVTVLASNSGGLTELVTHQETGFLAEPLNERSFATMATDVFLNPGKSKVLTANAYDKIKTYEISQVARGIYNIYASVLS